MFTFFKILLILYKYYNYSTELGCKAKAQIVVSEKHPSGIVLKRKKYINYNLVAFGIL